MEEFYMIPESFNYFLNCKVADPGGLPLPGIAGSNPARGYGCLCLVNAVCRQVEVSATGRSPVQKEFYRVWCVSLSVVEEALQLGALGPSWGCGATKKKSKVYVRHIRENDQQDANIFSLINSN